MTLSEKYIFELSKKSFLPFWSFPNPIGKKGKELCDVLVICENIVIIISVKDINVSDKKKIEIQYERWVKKAIYDSSDQIHGAERFLKTQEKVLLKDNKTWIDLPSSEKMKVYRIAIAFGSPNTFPLPMGDFGKGFIHVFDEQSSFTVLRELDTIKDFVNYLEAKENFFVGRIVHASTELDFLSFYIQTGFNIDPKVNYIVIDKGMWDSYKLSDEYKDWKERIQVSYFWDNMINYLYNYHIASESSSINRNELEEAIRLINLETRIDRIELGVMLKNAIESNVKARMIQTPSGKKHTYVFMKLNERNWDYKEYELKFRCDVARVLNRDAEIIIGISIGENLRGDCCFDIAYLNMPIISEDFEKYVEKVQKEYGYFENLVYSQSKDITRNS